MRRESTARYSIVNEFRGKANSNDWFRAFFRSIDILETPRPNWQSAPYTKNIYGVTANNLAFEEE
jgi:hypothetical protein